MSTTPGDYKTQVYRAHYSGLAYSSQERWNSYFHQLELVAKTKAVSVLEVGVGTGIVASELLRRGLTVKTLDIAADLSPDVLGSVTKIPLPDKSFDTVLAAEILEHIETADLPQALSEITRVSKKYVIISVPQPGYVFSTIIKIPLIQRFSVLFKIPFLWKTHRFNGEHYWELGKHGLPVSWFLSQAKTAGLNLEMKKSYADDPAHLFFLFTIR